MNRFARRRGYGIACISATTIVALCVILAAANYAHAVQFGGQVLDYSSKQLYHSPETPGYTSWTGLWTLPNGAIQCDFVQATGPLAGVSITYPLLQSTNNGKDWTKVGNNNGYSRGMAILPNGTTMVRPDMTGRHFNATGHLVYPNNNPAYPNNDFTGVQYSTNGGQTWSGTSNLVSPSEYQYCIPTRIKSLRDGRLVAMAGVVPKGVAPILPNIQKAMFVGTLSDQGLTWGAPIPPLRTAHPGRHPVGFRPFWFPLVERLRPDVAQLDGRQRATQERLLSPSRAGRRRHDRRYRSLPI
jgi:hypothetical protein